MNGVAGTLQGGDLEVYGYIHLRERNTGVLPVNDVDRAGNLLCCVTRCDRGKLIILAETNGKVIIALA